jgi:uncharacterized protein YwgA
MTDNSFSPTKVALLLIAVFGIGYTVGNSDEDKLKLDIDNIINQFSNNVVKLKEFIIALIETTEDIDSDELRINFERVISYAQEKIDKIEG